MKKIKLLIYLVPLVIWSCMSSVDSTTNGILYFGGDILTMEGESPVYVEALVERDGKIVFVGSRADADEAFANTQKVNLNGKTLVPGFIDGHLHFSALGAQALASNLLATPDGNVDTIDDLIIEMSDWASINDTELFNGWIVGIGYDDAVLGRHPNKLDLDKVSLDKPVIAVHISGHFCTMNSKGLEVYGITAETKDPVGGQIRRMPESLEPDGTLDELAGIPYILNLISPQDSEKITLFLDAAQDMAVSFGYTTAQEGRITGGHENLESYANSGKLKIDVPGYVDYTRSDLMKTDWYGREYKNHYRLAGLKLTLDGSPQGRTAWRTTPYILPPDGAGKDYKGYPAIPDDVNVQEIVDMAYENNWQLLTHANGDAAIDQMIRSIGQASKKYGNDNRRSTLIHGQYLRYDQIDSLAKYKIIPSLFPMHTFYWGDWHKQIIGEELGDKISPIKTALTKCEVVTSHTDAPVALPNLMMIMWTTVNRVSRSGAIIGADERLTPYEALKSITIWGAYQHFEEDKKGSFKVGKLADMVVLDKNPLKVDQEAIKDIQVMETIKEGVTIFSR
jgi:predicted amidohydrolase YtcJ